MNNREIIDELSLKDKAYLVTGKNSWEIRSFPAAGLDGVVMTDGPHGIRKPIDLEAIGLEGTEEAICFPPAVATACTFNEELIYSMGQYLAEEMISMDIQILLGPGANIKRSPLCGRNFEYFSEDPYHSGKIASAFIRGVQSKGVGTSLKHYVANNQETKRMTISAKIDERTLREIYLASFEEPVKVAQPWTIMAAYNRINGTYACENSYLLEYILRDEWGYEGVILSDWGAVDELPTAIAHGLDLEMPGSGSVGPESVIQAVERGTLDEKDLDVSVDHLIDLIKSANASPREGSYDKDVHHNRARQVAQECIVLLKNNDILPLQPGMDLCVIGELATQPRIQGGGSSKINAYQVDTLHDELTKVDDLKMTYSRGYDWHSDAADPDLEDHAVDLARTSDVCVLLVGLPDRYETEGVDRKHLALPPNQLALVEKLIQSGTKLVVLVTAGSVVKLPFADQVDGLLYTSLLGEAGAGALVDILRGEANPSGKLAETFIKDEAGDPSSGNFPGDDREVVYEEGIFVGYRYHDRYDTDVLYPFGHGLSYTSFSYSNLQCSADTIVAGEELGISLTITNTGDYQGKEVVQLYVSEQDPEVDRPPKELKRFSKIELSPGESKKIDFTLNMRCFAYYHVGLQDWYVKPGRFSILVGSSSKDIRLQDEVVLTNPSSPEAPPTEDVYVAAVDPPSLDQIHRNTTVGMLQDHPLGERLYPFILQEISPFDTDDANISDDAIFDADTMKEFVDNLPLRNLVSFGKGQTLTTDELSRLISSLNANDEAFIAEFMAAHSS